MSEWKMEPTQLSKALQDATAAQNELSKAVTEETLVAISEGLRWGDWVTGRVFEALRNVLEEQQTVNLVTISNHVVAGIQGVGNSALALQRGDEEMAAAFQTEMSSAASDGDFSFFEEHGYKGE